MTTGIDELRAHARGLAVNGKLDEAEAALDKALLESPDDTGAPDLLGYVLYMKGRHKEALACCDRSLAVDARNHYARKGRGLCLVRLGRTEEGIEDLLSAVGLKPDWFDGYCDLGITCSEIGDTDRAREALRRAVAIDPSREADVRNALRAMWLRSAGGSDSSP